jgi:hypothetical protein
MFENVFKPESGDASVKQSSDLYQQVAQSFDKQSFKPQGTDQNSLKDLLPPVDIYDSKAGQPAGSRKDSASAQPADSLVKFSASTPQDSHHPATDRSQSQYVPVADRHNPNPNRASHHDMSAHELQLGMLAKAFNINITKNRDGSYDVKSPLDNPQQAASGILNKVFSGLMGHGDGGSAPVGMNPWHARAWKGWAEDPGQRQQEEARRRQEEQQAKQRWERSGR